jgi:hypothetical protein
LRTLGFTDFRFACSTGDINVFENTPAVTAIVLNGTNCTGKNIPAPFFRRPIRLRYFRECSTGDIKVFENTPAVTFINLNGTKCTGKIIQAPFMRGKVRL